MLKLKLIQFVPRRRALIWLAEAAGGLGLASGRLSQPAALALAQRMLRQLQQNIIPQGGRQVHAVIDDGDRVFALQRQMGGPARQFQEVLEWFETPDALAAQGQAESALDQQAVFELLDFEVIPQRVRKLDDIVPRFDIQFPNRHVTG